MSNAWFRTYSEWATDPKVQSISEAMQRRLMMLFCLRCSNSLATLHETEVAFALRISEEELAQTKVLFTQKKFIDEQWNILNWEKRQYVSDSSTERSRKHREKKKTLQQQNMQHECNVAATPTDTEQIQNRIEKKESKATGSRFALTELPEDWKSFCQTTRPDLNPEAVFEEFADYWKAIPGQRGRKADWFATWRNRVRDKKSGVNNATNKPNSAQGIRPNKSERAKAAILESATELGYAS